MKTRISRAVASLALATALLSGSTAAFASTPDVASPALYDLGALGELGVPVDLGALGNLADPGAHAASPFEIANGATGTAASIVGAIDQIPAQAAGVGFGIANAAVHGAPVPALPVGLPGLP
jgi:hypothetical protein